MATHGTLAMAVTTLMAGLGASVCAAPPPTEGLILWLDAAADATVTTDQDGRVTRWHDRSPRRNHATPGSDIGPRLATEAFAGTSAVRFSGSEYLQVDSLAPEPGDLSVFVVFQRLPEQASDRQWQRLLSCWDGKSPGDNKRPSFQICTRDGTPVQPMIFAELLNHRHRGPMWIGANMQGPHQFLQGDIAEILVYDHGFLVDEQIQAVRRYLRTKWAVPEPPDQAWTRVGILPNPPARRTAHDPLSDQDNEGEWTAYSPMWDEFDGVRLDRDRWWDHNPRWYGRAPSRYLGEGQNVHVADGMMHIVMKRDDTLPEETFYRNGAVYANYSAGSIVSKQPVRYGYFEIRARAMPSAGSSAFWFSAKVRHRPTGKPYRSEIDVFEIGGRAPGHERAYHMNAHIFETPDEGARHWSKGGTWQAPFEFADATHVFGLYWGPDMLRYYVDGVEVRRMKNTHWHAPMFMIFDSETMGSWLGMPDDSDLPSTFSTDYVRAWKNSDTQGHWQDQFETIGDPTQPTDITRYVRSMDAHSAPANPNP